jgi:hypothetical protein
MVAITPKALNKTKYQIPNLERADTIFVATVEIESKLSICISQFDFWFS